MKPVAKPISALTALYRKAAEAAIAVSGNAYAPYSGFNVGAALIHSDGAITTGCNCENCIYQGCCGERCAIITANAEGRRTAVAVAVYGAMRDPSIRMPDDTLVAPCGLCRQMLNEVASISGNPLDIIMVSTGKKTAFVTQLDKLLPLGFGPSDIGINVALYRTKKDNDIQQQVGSSPKKSAEKQSGKKTKK